MARAISLFWPYVSCTLIITLRPHLLSLPESLRKRIKLDNAREMQMSSVNRDTQTYIDAYGFADDKAYIWGGILFMFVEFVLCAM